MSRDGVILLVIGIAVIVLLARTQVAPESRGVSVRMGTYGARIDYGTETAGGGCCG